MSTSLIPCLVRGLERRSLTGTSRCDHYRRQVVRADNRAHSISLRRRKLALNRLDRLGGNPALHARGSHINATFNLVDHLDSGVFLRTFTLGIIQLARLLRGHRPCTVRSQRGIHQPLNRDRHILRGYGTGADKFCCFFGNISAGKRGAFCGNFRQNLGWFRQEILGSFTRICFIFRLKSGHKLTHLRAVFSTCPLGF